MAVRFITASVAAAILAIGALTPSLAADSATSTTVKFGYFNLALVKASFPEAAGSEALRVQAENQLRQYVEDGNKRLQKMQDEKKTKEEIEKAARDLQVQINAQQQALIQLVQTQNSLATQAIAQSVAAVAKEKGLDVVVDGAGVFAGGDKLVNNGVDVTDAIVKRLSPNANITKPSSSATNK